MSQPARRPSRILSGNGNNANCVLATCPTSGIDGISGKGVQFDGDDDVIQATTNNFPTWNSDRTMAVWFKVESFIHSGHSAALLGYGTFGTLIRFMLLRYPDQLFSFPNGVSRYMAQPYKPEYGITLR